MEKFTIYSEDVRTGAYTSLIQELEVAGSIVLDKLFELAKEGKTIRVVKKDDVGSLMSISIYNEQDYSERINDIVSRLQGVVEFRSKSH